MRRPLLAQDASETANERYLLIPKGFKRKGLRRMRCNKTSPTNWYRRSCLNRHPFDSPPKQSMRGARRNLEVKASAVESPGGCEAHNQYTMTRRENEL